MRGAHVYNLRSISLAFAVLAGFLGFGHPAEVYAQSENLFCPGGFSLRNGACVSNPGVVDPAGLSGAALASQALSELSQSTTETTNRTLGTAIKDRREQETERCAAGFSRIDGVCQPIAAPAAETAGPAVTTAAPAGVVEKPRKKARAAKEEAEAAKITPKARVSRPVARREPRPVAVLPLPPVEPEARFAVWTQVYGDYERRNANTSAAFEVTPPPGSSSQFVGSAIDVHSQSGTVGFLAGGDFTSRGVLYGNDGLIAGVMGGYVSSNLNLQTFMSPNSPVTGCSTNCNSVSHTSAKLSGPSAGLYATYFNGGFSTDFSLKVDALSLSENFDNWLTLFAPGVTVSDGVVSPAPFATLDRQALVQNGGSTHLLNSTVAGNLSYRFYVQPTLWIEPTVGAQYTNSSYASDAAQLGLADGSLVMVQGGARFGSNLFWNNVRMTTILTGLAYDDVLVSGGFIPGAGLFGNNILAAADQGRVRGRGILALNLDFGQGVSSFIQGEVRGGSGLFGAGGRAGVRYQW